MGFNQHYGGNDSYQQAGFKNMERFDITLRVIECIDLMGDLFTSLRFRGIAQESLQVYEAFINAFFKIFHITGSMMKEEDLELIASIDEAFSEKLELTSRTADKFISLFEEYLQAMKKAGVYDPLVVRQFINPLSAWQESL